MTKLKVRIVRKWMNFWGKTKMIKRKAKNSNNLAKKIIKATTVELGGEDL